MGMGGNAAKGERALKYKEPLEGSKYPWRGKKRKKKKNVVVRDGTGCSRGTQKEVLQDFG